MKLQLFGVEMRRLRRLCAARDMALRALHSGGAASLRARPNRLWRCCAAGIGWRPMMTREQVHRDKQNNRGRQPRGAGERLAAK